MPVITSPVANLYTATLDKIKSAAPSIRYINQDLGQLDFYDDKPPVSWPCALVDVGELTYNDAIHGMQIAAVNITIRLGLLSYSDTSSLATDQLRALGLQYYQLEHELGNALHKWQPAFDEIGTLVRVSVSTEKRDDNVRVRVLTFTCTLQYDGDALAPTITPLEIIANNLLNS